MRKAGATYSIRKGLGYLDDAFTAMAHPQLSDAILAVAGEDVAPNLIK